MFYNLIIYILSYFLILFSIIGYGLILLKILDKKLDNTNFGYVGLFGIYLLIVYSYLSNYIIAHSQYHNLIVIIFGLLLFILFIKKKIFKFKKEIILSIIVFSTIFISLLIFKNHDDFPYYHFPYTHYLTNQSLFFGVGQFNHGFRTPSSIFYLNSLFYLPLAEYYLFNFGQTFILGFANIILLKKIHNYFVTFEIKLVKLNFINYLSLFSLIFINIFFYRIAEHGTDRSAQILIFIFIIEILNLINSNDKKFLGIPYIFLLAAIIISLKAFYILYILFFLPLFLFSLNKYQNFYSGTIELINNRFFLLFSVLLIFVLGSYFINTGCIIYPLTFTCIDTLSWSISYSEVKLMNNWYELWSKAGAGPNFRVENPQEYIQNFNWLGNWITEYFFNKVSDFIFGVIFLILFVLLLFRQKLNLKNFKKKNKLIFFVYFILLLLAFEWFYNHPALRYGGYCIFALILFIPISILLEANKINYKKFNKIVFLIILLTSIIFLTRNVSRINKEVKIYNYEPIKSTFYFIDDHYFRIQYELNSLLKKNEDCLISEQSCNFKDSKVKKKYGKIIFINSK